MRRTERLFHIIQILRSSRSPVTGRALADELEISLRTLYRDMAELMAQRVPITGEAGTGYVLDDAYDMPPLMLTADELEAAALGAAWVATQADPSLARSARDLVAKLSAAIPSELRPIILDAGVKPIATKPPTNDQFDGVILRRAIRSRTKLQLIYKDQSEQLTTRIIWPLFIAYLDKVRYIVAWCESRDDYRHFRTDRVHSMEVQPDKYPARRASLIKGWEETVASRRQVSK
ncbi:Helix-turn-helix type 11 domain protein [Pseudovibrio sp. FO-BEG1]|uniref:helix-turn-helix transcriptional regulator n=1 Tax=Pseudovibrio sp. (strain FO-BEG1) TaxID=911045 RepID=UPI000238BFCD|nr:YafY family protein [Pseudovibrio sp. FO-BEG1]AEV39441.1 Helix-turn-helix type 11 domain protein [Pseudovibrio sp. FO-BEG1]